MWQPMYAAPLQKNHDEKDVSQLLAGRYGLSFDANPLVSQNS